jgi:rhodanese-related sulfurtransferase
MNARQLLTLILLPLGGLLAVLPGTGKYALHGRADRLWTAVAGDSFAFTPDQVARFVVTEDSTVQLIDLRPAADYRMCNIPGSVNLPYAGFFDADPEPYLTGNSKVIFYSNGDRDAAYALAMAHGMGFTNCYVMKGGLNEWFRTVMNSEFTGEWISARENALFETRFRARKLFTEVNSMPDSLKTAYMASKRFDPKKLDGGCE